MLFVVQFFFEHFRHPENKQDEHCTTRCGDANQRDHAVAFQKMVEIQQRNIKNNERNGQKN
jgi:hypothetical protein